LSTDTPHSVMWKNVENYHTFAAIELRQRQDDVITYCCSQRMTISSPVMTTRAATPYKLHPRSSQINRAMLPQASHRVVIANMQLYVNIVFFAVYCVNK